MIGRHLACPVCVNTWGSDNAISDITPAAGWGIIDCPPDAPQQDIRLVCKDDSSANCAHLYGGTTTNNNGAVGKVVRLPENCGKSAFTVVTKAYTPQDQTLPSNPTVKSLQLDTSFSSVNPSTAGPVNFAIRAANVPGANGDLPTSPQQQRRSNSRIFRRGT
ncbi:hypothetical protein K443DRAFT_120960 [Laccaria amethystina LaAM-08-1]|uniref:Uncharacterized protein n=1 Tax=Laccaria amethystina LaAM-08-1 TaxID=1095629 RepID=A0A0C9Y2W1_9AGAR|nr:hypothetical protein K443DRAFT_120960 [Laccaria amethystina LaAM-08-1]